MRTPHRCRRHLPGGFTLIELMLVVAIIGLLASAAVPTFNSYVRRAKTVEAIDALGTIGAGAKVYFAQHLATTTITVGATTIDVRVNQLPASSTGYTPTQTHADACARGGAFGADLATQFSGDPWRGLLFTPTGRFRYRYAWLLGQQSSSTVTGLAYAHALGDLDCDGVRFSVWRMIVREDRTGGDRLLQLKGPLIFSGGETD